jgi:hypothetical protein
MTGNLGLDRRIIPSPPPEWQAYTHDPRTTITMLSVGMVRLKICESIDRT